MEESKISQLNENKEGILIQGYKTISQKTEIEYIERKSRFLSLIMPVLNEEEAKLEIEFRKKQHSCATHNVYAYILQGTQIARFSDDGEPQGTAGMPILEVLKREELTGLLCIVTRYFGGILLGAGGLVRAYAKSAKLAIDKAGISMYVPFQVFSLSIGYSEYEKIQKSLSSYKVRSLDTDFTDKVTMQLSAEKENYEPFISFVNELTAGQSSIELLGERYESKTLTDE